MFADYVDFDTFSKSDFFACFPILKTPYYANERKLRKRPKVVSKG